MAFAIEPSTLKKIVNSVAFRGDGTEQARA
jgi:hypothetical protein